MKAINTSTFDFPRIITKNLFYVDKTAVGANFNSKKGQLDSWKKVEISH